MSTRQISTGNGKLRFSEREAEVSYTLVVTRGEYRTLTEGEMHGLSAELMAELGFVPTATLVLQDGKTVEIVPHGHRGFMGPVSFSVNTSI